MVENEIINEAIEYIYKHIDNKLTVDEIAEHYYVSKYHFCRLFKNEIGESVYEFIKRNCIFFSAISLKSELNRSITDVGLEGGYSASN